VVLDALVGGGRLTDGRFAASYLIDHGFAAPVDVVVERVPIRGVMRERPFGSIYREFVVDNAKRNRRIAAIALEHGRAGRSVLVLVDQVRHGNNILRLLGDGAAFVHGKTARQSLHATTRDFSRGELGVLVATSGLFMEGVSIDNIHVLVQGGGLKSRAKVIQSVGRGMRRAPGKTACLYVDFDDDDEGGVLRRHSRERLRVLREEGFDVPSITEEEPEDARWDEDVPPTWAAVPGTSRFALVDGDGRVHATARCLSRDLVPDEICAKCRSKELCTTGGRILWHDDPD